MKTSTGFAIALGSLIATALVAGGPGFTAGCVFMALVNAAANYFEETPR